MVRIIALLILLMVTFPVWAEEQPKPDEDKLIQIARVDMLMLGLGRSGSGSATCPNCILQETGLTNYILQETGDRLLQE